MQTKSFNTLHVAIFFILSFFIFNFAVNVVSADDPGVIDTSAINQAKVCHNVACDDFGIINFELELEPSISISSSTGISGNVWGDELGWINFNPIGAGVTFADSDTGVLTGSAWSQVSGWINFAPTGQGVTIDPDNGEFSGYAWSGGAYGGWIKFDCGDSSTCVRTTWRANNGGGGGGCTGKNCGDPPACEYPFTLIDGNCACEPPLVEIGGWCAYDDTFPDVCPNIPYLQVVVPLGMHLNSNGQCVNDNIGGGGSTGGPVSPGDPVNPSDPVDPTDPTDPIDPFSPSDPVDPTDPTDSGDGGGDDEEGFIPNIINVIQFDIIDLINQLTAFIKSPNGNLITKFISTFGLISGIVATLSGIFSFTDIGLNLLRLWSFFLYGMGFKKRNRPWGVVYDSVTKQPLDPAYVVLNDMQGNEIGSSITDLDGRYGFLVAPGIYTIVASKTNYTYPSTKLAGRTYDELYNDLYFGEQIEIKEEGEVIAKNIPLDQINFDWNEFAKKEQKRMKFYHTRDVLLARFSDFMFFLGFIVSIIILFVAPKPYNVIIFSLYIILLLVRRTTVKRNRKGRVAYKADNTPISYGILRVRSMASGQEVAHRVLDKTGGYYCLVPNGIYNANIEKKSDDGTYQRIFTSDNFEIKNGILKKDFKI